jgi:hypothetical protein
MVDEFEMYSERRAAVKAGVTRKTLRLHRKAGRIRPLVLAHTVLYSRGALEEWRARYFPRERSGGNSE